MDACCSVTFVAFEATRFCLTVHPCDHTRGAQRRRNNHLVFLQRTFLSAQLGHTLQKITPSAQSCLGADTRVRFEALRARPRHSARPADSVAIDKQGGAAPPCGAVPGSKWRLGVGVSPGCRAHQTLTSAPFAPGTDTLRQLRDPARVAASSRSRSPSFRRRLSQRPRAVPTAAGAP